MLNLKDSYTPVTAFQYVVYGMAGVGKTSLACYAPNPIILTAYSEQGYHTLATAGSVPRQIRNDTINGFKEVMEALGTGSPLYDLEPGTLIIDGVGEIVQSIAENVKDAEFDKCWHKFASYGAGLNNLRQQWIPQVTKALSKLNRAGWTTILIFHEEVKRINDPRFENGYDKIMPDIDPKTWNLFMKQADNVFYMGYVEKVENNRITGGKDRVLYPTGSNGVDAKNRIGLTKPLILPKDPTKMWDFVHSKATAIPEELNKRNTDANTDANKGSNASTGSKNSPSNLPKPSPNKPNKPTGVTK